MHRLARAIRFSVNPFLADTPVGFNSYASKPSGEGLSIFFELSVVLAGEVEPSSGFVVNVQEIDKEVRQRVVPVFSERLKREFNNARHIGISGICELLESACRQLAHRFGQSKLHELSLALNPFRKVTLKCEDNGMSYFIEKFEFAAMHKLWNEEFSAEHNFEVFGKCANPAGHGHNYILEVAVELPKDRDSFGIGEFERVVDEEFVSLVDHKNLNADIEEFARKNPTVENLASFAWEKLFGRFGQGRLHCVTVWETDKTYCQYYG